MGFLTSHGGIHSQALLWLTAVPLPSGFLLYYFIRPYTDFQAVIYHSWHSDQHLDYQI